MRAGLGAALLALAVWQSLVWTFGFQKFILPQPHEVAVALWDFRELIWTSLLVTGAEIAIGLVLGVLLGVLTALQLAASPFARDYIRPLLVFMQAVPIFALAPILVIWFGFGLGPKLAVVVIITYFPITSALFDGLTNTPPGYLDLARTMRAPRNRVIWYVRMPAAVPAFCSGLRLAAVYAPIGAFIAEWVGASEGLGALMVYANARTKIDLMFAAMAVLSILTVLLHATTDRFCIWMTRRFN